MKENGEAVKDLIVHSWNSKSMQTTKLWDKLAPWAMQQEVVPGGNKVIYLLGHLLAVQDKMIEGMNLGARLYPGLDLIFLTPQTPGSQFPNASELRTQWEQVNEVLRRAIEKITMDHWLSRHFYVSKEEFVNEPHRNVLNLLLTRTIHLANHNGQLILVKPLT